MLVDMNKEEMNIIAKALLMKIVAYTEFLKSASSEENVNLLNHEMSELQKLYDKYNVMANLNLE
mgnify:CR=1 FL=1